MTGRICLTPQELESLTGYALAQDQARFLDNLGVPYVARTSGTLGVLRNSIERRQAHLRRLWRDYCEQFAEYEDTLEVFEQRKEAMPYPEEPEFPEELRSLACGAKTRKGHPCRRHDLYPNGRCRMHGGPSTGPTSEAGKRQSALNGLRPKPDVTNYESSTRTRALINEPHGAQPPTHENIHSDSTDPMKGNRLL